MSPVNEDDRSDDDYDENGPPATICTPMKEAMKKGAAKARTSDVSAYRDGNVPSSDDSSIFTVEAEGEETEVVDDDNDTNSSGSSTLTEKTKTMLEAFKMTQKTQRKKKKKSTFGIGTTNSHRSGTTRGDTAREDKRKSKPKSHNNDNSSKASSKRSSKSSKSKSNTMAYSCFNSFDDEIIKQN
jgi:hypothetical protein